MRYEEMTWRAWAREIWNFAWIKHKWSLRIASGVFASLMIFFLCIYSNPNKAIIDRLDHVATFTTLLVAALIWVVQLGRDWESSLPLRVSVDFDCQNVAGCSCYVLRCQEAYLAMHADVRAWCQQIAVQMNEKPNEKLALNFDISQEDRGIIKRGKQYYKHIYVKYPLNEPPSIFKRDKCYDVREITWAYDFSSKQFNKHCRYYKNGQLIMADWPLPATCESTAAE